MKLKSLHTAAVTGFAAIALTAASSLAMPTTAQAIDPVTGAAIGGAAAGLILGGAASHHHDRTTVYSAPPAYAAPVVVERQCYYATQRIYDPYEGDYDYQRVRVC
ncbi:hypothetical protein [Chelativorans alearense]|uniref:hypothetical protein n=1 Tax=Chelativorans alearense TaxID=2681495 RepID=UPI0013D3E000|nr:hypothetical protein [Chelativorans alearense]